MQSQPLPNVPFGQENQYGFIPDAHSDPPYAVFVDESEPWTLAIGAAVVLGLLFMGFRWLYSRR